MFQNMIEAKPAAGKRVRYQLPADVGSGIYSALYLPSNWQPGKTYPVIAELPGNYFYKANVCCSSGRPEQCVMGYGISSEKVLFGLVFLLWIAQKKQLLKMASGSKAGADTVEYVQQVVNDICKNWGGDKDNLFLSGFSRGAISCGYVGLANDEISKLWKGLIACQHYDGSHWNQSRMNDAKRAARFKGKAIFQVDNKAEKFQAQIKISSNSDLGNHAMFQINDDSIAAMVQI